MKKKLNTLLLQQSKIFKLPITGVWSELFYHIVFVPDGNKFEPFMLFENGNNIPLKSNKKYSYFDDIGERHCIINTDEPLWFKNGVVNTLSSGGILSVIKKEKIDPKKLYDSVVEKLNDYYDFYNDEEIDIVFAHIVHTYILGLLGYTFYLLLEGEKNTGKSSLQGLMSALQHNGCFSGKITMAGLIRKIHFFQATVNIDELDKLHRDEMKVATGILNSGMYRNGTYEIVNIENKKSNSQIKIYHTFGAKTFSVNRVNLDDSLISRCIVINTVRNQKRVKSIHRMDEKELNAFQGIRNRLFAYCLLNGRLILKDIDCIQEKLEQEGIFGRRSDIIGIICGILKHFKSDYRNVLEYLKSSEEFKNNDETESRFYVILDFLIEKMELDFQKQVVFSNKELRDYIIEQGEIDEGSHYAPSNRSVGSLLKKHRIVDRPEEREKVTSGVNKNCSRYRVSTEKLIKLIMRTEFDDLKERLAELGN